MWRQPRREPASLRLLRLGDEALDSAETLTARCVRSDFISGDLNHQCWQVDQIVEAQFFYDQTQFAALYAEHDAWTFVPLKS